MLFHSHSSKFVMGLHVLKNDVVQIKEDHCLFLPYVTFLHLFAWSITLTCVKPLQKNILSPVCLYQMQTIGISLSRQTDILSLPIKGEHVKGN